MVRYGGAPPVARLASGDTSPQYPTKTERRKYAPLREPLSLSFLKSLFAGPRERIALRPLYDAVVGEGRDPAWYRDGGVPDTVDGRFDMVAAVLALVLLRFEAEGDAARGPSVLLTETFIDDMDASLRELGIGDLVVGKKVGRIMGALGGRLGSFRASADDAEFEGAVRRNVFRDEAPSQEALCFVADRLRGLRARLAAAPLDRLLAGETL